MILFPAIDILDGRAVRLLYGKKENVTDYGDPVDRAKEWIDQGAEWLHIVDLSGAFDGDPPLFAALAAEYGEKIVAGIDAKNGYLSVKGWTELSSVRAVDFGKQAKGMGVTCALFTDISKDGAMQGANVEATVQMQKETGLNVIASGGIASMDDLYRLKKENLYGAILGRSIYTGAIKLAEAIAACK
jgi:phosphoribosylformimino-5-aminoimidazole carboxamide ribotide isomerase